MICWTSRFFQKELIRQYNSSHESKCLIPAVENFRRRGFHEILEDCGVNTPEIRGEFQVALRKVGETWMLAIKATFYCGSSHKQARSLPVVGSTAGIFLHPATELGKCHDRNPLLVPLPFEVRHE